METLLNRPEVLNGYTLKLSTPCGQLYFTLNECEDSLCEVRATLGKSGSCMNIMLQTIALLISVMLQSGIDKEIIKKALFNQFEGNCGQTIWRDGERYHSCVDWAIQKILEDMASRGEVSLEA